MAFVNTAMLTVPTPLHYLMQAWNFLQVYVFYKVRKSLKIIEYL